MGDPKFLYTINKFVQVSITERDGKGRTEPELATEAILSLLGTLDIKSFAENDIYDKFDESLEQIADMLHAVCKRAGWQDGE